MMQVSILFSTNFITGVKEDTFTYGDEMMNKKQLLLAITMIFSSLVVPVQAKSPNQIMLSSPDYVLNILGKAQFTDNPMQDSPDRHTIFVPLYDSWRLYIEQAKRGSGESFQVLDANAVVDGVAVLKLGDGYYSVWIAALGKPGGSTDGDAVVSATDIMVNLGLLHVERAKGTPDWNDETGLFFMTYEHIYSFFYQYYIGLGYSEADAALMATADADYAWTVLSNSGLVWDPAEYSFLTEPAVWVFDFFDYLAEIYGMSGSEYYWNMKNKGLRHMQLRFYKVKNRNFEWVMPEPEI